ncbi:glycosyl hydrolase family 28-related protein [Arthrobacter sp. MMS24-S77]
MNEVAVVSIGSEKPDASKALEQTAVRRRYILRLGTLATATSGVAALSVFGSGAKQGTDAPMTSGLFPVEPLVAAADITSNFVSKGSLLLNVRDYGAKGDGVTDDFDAISAALAAATGKALYFPSGLYLVQSPRRLVLTGNSTSIVGDFSGLASAIRFTNPTGGLDIGDGNTNVYENRLINIAIHGANSATTLVRLRNVYEAYFNNTRIEATASTSGATLVELDSCGQLDADRLTLSGAPIGVKISGSVAPIINMRLANFYLLTECIVISAPFLGRLALNNSWVETCTNVITLNRPAGSISVGEIIVRDVRAFTSGVEFRLMKAAAFAGVNSQRVSFEGCYVDAQNATTPLVDFTAVDNSSATFRVSVNRCIILLGGIAPLIKPHPRQAWFLFLTDVDRITGLPVSRWSAPAASVGGTWPVPPRLSGNGTPEGTVAAPIGSTFVRIDGTPGGTFYVKESGGTGRLGG